MITLIVSKKWNREYGKTVFVNHKIVHVFKVSGFQWYLGLPCMLKNRYWYILKNLESSAAKLSSCNIDI